MTSRKH